MNNSIDFIATNFAANLSDTYSISIRQLPDGYIFYITNDNGDSVAIKRIVTDHITPALLANEPLLQHKYRSATYIGYGPFAVIPKALIADENYTAFLPIENNLRQRAISVVNPINADTLIAAYSNQWSIPNAQCTMHNAQCTTNNHNQSELRHNCRKHHEIELLITAALQSNSANSMWTEITSNHINIVVIKDHKLHLANSYPIACDNDAAYYILACYQQLELSQETTPLNILGNTIAINPQPFLKDYIRNITTPQPTNWSPDFPNEYSTLFTLQDIDSL